jgi:hypothetical protein
MSQSDCRPSVRTWVASAWCGMVMLVVHGMAAEPAREANAQSLQSKDYPESVLVDRLAPGRVIELSTPAEWQRKRERILAAFQSVAGKLPGNEKRCPLEMRVLEETDRGSYVRRLIEYSSEPGGRVPAYLAIPKALLTGAGMKAPAALCLHPTDNRIGHGVIVGLGGKANRQYASELAERGYVTLSPAYPLLANYQPELKQLGWESGTLKAVWDNMRGLDLLDSLPYVKPGAYAAIGHSLGGHNSVYTAIFDERIRVVVSSCGLDAYRDYYNGNEAVWMPEKGWCQTRYMPKLAEYRGRLDEIPFDFHELIAAIAPRRVFISAPLKDSNFRHDSVARIGRAARPAFALLGEPRGLEVVHPDCEHDFPDAIRQRAYAVIDKALK